MSVFRWGAATTFVLFVLDMIGVLNLSWWQVFTPLLAGLVIALVFIIGFAALFRQ